MANIAIMGAHYYSGESYKQLVTGCLAIKMMAAINNFGNQCQLKLECNNVVSFVNAL